MWAVRQCPGEKVSVTEGERQKGGASLTGRTAEEVELGRWKDLEMLVRNKWLTSTHLQSLRFVLGRGVRIKGISA